MSTAMNDSDLYCTFWVDDLFFGLSVGEVQEVLRQQEATPVPMAPRAVCGLINLRGQIVTAVDLRNVLGLPAHPEGAGAMNVVIRSDDDPISLLVDRIGDVISVGDLAPEPVPTTVPDSVRSMTTGVIALPDRLLLLLDRTKATAA